MSLLADLEEFVTESITPRPPDRGHDQACNGYLLTVACRCGVVFERRDTLRRRETFELTDLGSALDMHWSVTVGQRRVAGL
jgi:hypothetical protein